jgi:hypothetical protein
VLLAGQIALQPGAGVRPVSFDGSHRKPEVLGDLRAGHAGKESQDHDLGGTRVDGFETRQRGFERQEIFDRHRAGGGRLEKVVENDGLNAPTALLTLLMASMIDEYPSHGLSAKRESVRLALPFRAAVVLQSDPRFVNERSRLERVVLPFTPQIAARDPAQLAVDGRKELVRRSRTFGCHQLLKRRPFAACVLDDPEIGVGLAPKGEKVVVSLPRRRYVVGQHGGTGQSEIG